MIVEHLDLLFRTGGIKEKEGAAEAATERLLRTIGNKIHGEAFTREKGSMYPSDSGKCTRKVQYAYNAVPEEPSLPETSFKFMMGDLLELAVIYALKHCPGIRISGNNEKMEIDIDGKGHKGATDGIVQYKRKNAWSPKFNLEVKSMSRYGFQNTVKNGIDNTWGYLTQAEVYMREQLKRGLIDKPGGTIFLLIDRDTMKFADELVAYTGKYADEADARFKRVKEATAEKRMVTRDYLLKADGTLDINCSYCGYKWGCWSEPHVMVSFNKKGEPVYPEGKKMRKVVERSIVRGRPVFAPVEV